MRIERIEINTFGRFSQLALGPFACNLVVIHDPYEAGAATVRAFIRTMLAGPPESHLQAARQVTASGSYGGWLVLRAADNRSYTVERFLATGDGAARVTGPNDETTGDEILTVLLAGISPELYLALCSFGAADLRPVEAHADGANGDVRAAGSSDDGDITQTLRDLEAIERDLDSSPHTAAPYHDLCRQREAVRRDLRDVNRQLAAIERFERCIAMEARRLKAIASKHAPWSGAGPTGPEDMIAWRRTIDELRESWTRLQALRRMNDVYQQTVNRQRIPRSPWFLVGLTLGVMLPVILGTITGHVVILSLGIASAVLGMITLLLAAIARSRFESAQLQAMLHLEMTLREAQGRFLHAAMRARVDPDHIEEEVEHLEDAYAHLLEVRERAESAEAQRAETWRTLAAELDLPAAQAGSPTAARAAAEERVAELLREQERLDARLQQIDGERQVADLRHQRRERLTLLDGQVRGWLAQLAAGTLPPGARGPSSQPDILRAASDFFDAMTLGAYHQLTAQVGGGLVALGRDGREIDLTALRPGTREQAQLALRIALIQAFGAAGRPLPVLVDDFLARFEREQAVEALRSLSRLTSDQQVLIFTHEPATVALARCVVPDAEVVRLGDRKVTGLAPLWLDNC